MTYPVEGAVQFNNVTFAYPSRPTDPALRNMSFKISKGECIGIVG